MYFRPRSFWNDYKVSNEWALLFQSNVIGEILHGFDSLNNPGSSVLLFEPPFFIVFKTSNIENNYLSFIDFQKPNAERTILSMINFDDERNIFQSEYTPELYLPYTNGLSLGTVLEFTLVDSQNNSVHVADKSQLFIVLSLL